MNILSQALWISMCFLLGLDASLAAQSARFDELTLETSDGVQIAATIGLPEEAAAIQLPAVILIHQGGSDRHEWDDFSARLVQSGFVTLAYDVRGHGESTPVKDIYELFNNPDLAPRDLDAVLADLKSRPEVDSQRLAIVGASIGANLAAAAISRKQVKTAVAISGKPAAARNLLGSDSLRLHSVFWISSAGDQEGKRAAWAQEFYQLTTGPRQLKIVPNSNAHGVGVLKDDPALEKEILEWLRTRL